MEAIELLKDLNPEQLAAVTHGEGPLMIIAGAGTGKTTVITRRIAWLISEGKAKSEEILALTFTDKAANEMEERVDKLLPMGYLDLSISTFHAFCEKVLRKDGIHIGIPEDFKLFTEVDAWLMMRRNLSRFSLDYFRPRGAPTKFLRQMMTHFSRAKDEGITPEHYLETVEEMTVKKSGGAPEAFAAMQDEDKLDLEKWQELSGAYAMYEKLLAENHAIDFGGLLLLTLELFKKRPNILAEYRKKFSYVVVDEFQDTNSIQYELVKLLAEPKRNITVVGDDDQAIYKFRGAALKNILDFRKDFPDATKVVLTRNYRSGKEILDRAYTLIQANNPHRLEAAEGLSKELSAHVPHQGYVEHQHFVSHEDEIETVVKTIIEAHDLHGAAWSDCAILVRGNDAADPFLEALERAGVPYRFVALSGLYSTPIILDSLAYFRVIADPMQSPSWYRILSHPLLGLSEDDLAELLHFVRRKSAGSIFDAMRSLTQSIGVSMEGRNRMLEVAKTVDELREKAKRLPVTELFVEILKKTGLLGNLKMASEEEQQEQFRYLEGFLSRLKRFVVANPQNKLVHAFLEEFDAEREAGEGGGLKQNDEEGPDVVQVMTVHAAKGLEFRFVFVVNMIEQRFPSVSRSEQLPLPAELLPKVAAELDDHVAEERRLFYVAMTRAKEGLYLFSAEDYGGSRKRKPSRFLTELGFDTPALAPKDRSSLISERDDRQKKLASSAVPLETPHTFSFSQIAAFSTCPLQYKYAHILKIPTFGRHQFSFGQTMHLTLERFMRRLLEGTVHVQGDLFSAAPSQERNLPSERDLLDLYRAAFIDEWYPSVEIRDEYTKKGEEALKAFYASVKAAPPKPLMLEAGFTLKLGDIMLKGRIDRLDACEDGVEIIDYKTGMPKEKLDWKDRRQLILYALAGERCFEPPLKVKKLTYYYFENNSSVSFEPTEKDKEKLISEIQETISEIKKGEFPPEANEHNCKYCDFQTICPFAKL